MSYKVKWFIVIISISLLKLFIIMFLEIIDITIIIVSDSSFMVGLYFRDVQYFVITDCNERHSHDK